VQDLAERELGGVALVDGVHQLLDARERVGAAEVRVDHASGGLGARHDHVVGGAALDAQRLGVVVVERDVHVRVVRQVRGDVTRVELDQAVLHVLGVDELDVVEHVEVLEEGGTHQPVEVRARDQSEALGLKLRHGDSIGRNARELQSDGGRVPSRAWLAFSSRSRSPSQSLLAAEVTTTAAVAVAATP
jgi:hypothetical protein